MADFSLSFEGIEWAFVSGVYDSNYIISVRNVGYVRSAGRVLKEAFGAIGSAGGHSSMAKAIIPLGTQSIRQMDKKVQQMFLHALHSTR
jgi:nanoRNase/pAp phosphatase (c-di-AMP/oligoRNAs hydrolase)